MRTTFSTFARFHLQVQFEAYLAKMAVETLKMTAEEYQALKTRNNQRRFMETLYQRARAMNVTMHDLEALYISLLHHYKVASRTHLEWQPAEVHFYFICIQYAQCWNSNGLGQESMSSYSFASVHICKFMYT